MDRSGRMLELENLSGQRISMHAATGALCLCGKGGDSSLESDSWLEAVYQPGMEIWKPDSSREPDFNLETDFSREQGFSREPDVHVKPAGLYGPHGDPAHGNEERCLHDWTFMAYRRNNELCFKALCDDVGIIGTWRPHDWGFELNAAVRNTGAGIVSSARIRFSGLKMPPDSFFALPHGAG